MRSVCPQVHVERLCLAGLVYPAKQVSWPFVFFTDFSALDLSPYLRLWLQ